MTSDLNTLAENRDALLLAEVGAWLHDMGKCSDEMIEKQATDCPPSPQFQSNNDYKTAFSYLLNGSSKQINLLNEPVPLKDLVEKGMPWAAGKKGEKLKITIRYLGRCHAAAHIEKEGQADAKQTVNDTRLSSPFGYETEPLKGLTDKLKSLPFDRITDRKYFLDDLKKAFKNALGDTERPINEVDLWDWSSIVAALYKSALAGALLGNKPEPNYLKWRLLAIRFNSEQIWGNASKIPVLFARKKWLTDGLDEVKILLEETYPLGNEVYRDENGSVFVVPDIGNLLKIIDSDNGKTLEELILKNLGYDGEIVITPALSDNWWGQNPSRHSDPEKDEIPHIAEILIEKPYSPPNPEAVKKWWEEAKGNPEICTISWLRPQGPTEKGFRRKASDYWAKKVTDTAKERHEHLDKTIWIDEVADSNGRICLITGKLDISEWLKPDGYIKTLFVKPPNGNQGKVFQKTPSFARIRRVWETTKKFWEDVECDFQKNIGIIRSRLRIYGNFMPENGNSPLHKLNAYEADLNGVRFSIFSSNNKELLVIENLQWLAKEMGADQNDLERYESSVKYVKRELDGNRLKIYDSEGKNREKPIGFLEVSTVEDESTPYTPDISILSEPSTFMAIVPANKALEVARGIKEKYGKEMGKVRNRLPLTLGMVFAKSHTPLVALMDAGRRMLNVDNKEEDWTITEDAHDCGMHCTLNFGNGIIWHVPVKMGDDETDDIWYPYFYVNGNLPGRSRAFKGPKGWLVHVKELKKGDEVRITPSRFDFEFLDSASRRFEVSYGNNRKRRDTTKSERPYLLEELEDFEKLWKILDRGLSRSQIKNVIGLIETKREEWLPEEGNDVFEKFVHDVLHNANWEGETPPNIGELENATISGKLKDIVELNMNILKVRNTDKKRTGGI